MKKRYWFILLISLLCFASVAANNHNTLSQGQIGQRISNVQWAVSSQERWYIWDIIANIFLDSTAYIKNAFITAFMNIHNDDSYNNQVLRWVHDGIWEWRFEAGTIRDDGTSIGIGAGIDDNYTVNIAGSINFSWDIYRNNSLFSSGKFIDGVNSSQAVYTQWNVGIGTNNPSQRLHVAGAMHIDGSMRVNSIYSQDNDSTKAIAWGTSVTSSSNILLHGSNHPERANQIRFNTWVTSRLTILSEWNVGIWTNNPNERLDVDGNIRATAFLYASDKNLKTDIAPYTDGKQVIAGIETKRYNWKDTWETDIWVIAQDVQKVFPEAVSQWEDGILAVDYAKLVVPLLQVVQEQQQVQELQDQRIAELEAIIQSLLN